MTQELMQELAELESEAQRLLHTSPSRYRIVAERMLGLSARAGPGAQARALRVHGNALRVQGRLAEADSALRQALRLWRRAGQELEWARTQTARVAVLAQIGKISLALRSSREGLAIFLRHGERLPAARLLSNTGGLHLYSGKPAEALRCFVRAYDLALPEGDRPLLSRIELNRAGALQALGHHRQALARCGAARRFAGAQQFHIARIQLAAAISLFHLGRFDKALRRFSVARGLFEAESSPQDVGECDLHICACYLELNRVEQALVRARAVLAEPGRARAWYEIAYAWYYEGVALARLGRRQQASASLNQARRLFARHGDRYWAGRAALEEAAVLLRIAAAGPALRRAAFAKRLLGAAGSSVERARASLVIAEGSLATGRTARARAEGREALQTFQRAHTPGPTFRCLHLLGQIALRRRQFVEARRYLELAIRHAERLRANVQVAYRQSFLDDKAAAYADLVWLHLQEERLHAAHRLADRARARGLYDLLVTLPEQYRSAARPEEQRLLAEIEAVRREYQQLTLPAPLGRPETRGKRASVQGADPLRSRLEQRLAMLWDEWELRQSASSAAPRGAVPSTADQAVPVPFGTAVVEYLVLRDRIVAFVSDHRRLCGWVDLGSPAPVRKALELLELNLETALQARSAFPARMEGLTRNARLLLLDLYRRLWQPLLPWVGAREQVLVIPHGPLHLVPFPALYNGSQYLVERTELSFAPSREIWAQCRKRAAAFPEGLPDLVMGFNPDGLLPHVDEEARWVAGALGAPALLGSAAGADRLSEGPYRVVHLAVHGQFRPDNPHFSTLLLADGPLTTADAASLRTSASLVVLSGCETGLSRVTHGEELIGMVASFLVAGSAAVLASRWRVDDRETAALMRQVYQSLLRGEGKGAALRKAQAEMARLNYHPLFWAAFFVVGDTAPLPEYVAKEGVK